MVTFTKPKEDPFIFTEENYEFKVGDHVVYPVHGVGKIIAIEKQSFESTEIEFLVIQFDQDKMVLRLPKPKVSKSGLRPVMNSKIAEEIEEILKKRVRLRRMMWSRRAQEYEAKINSGNPTSIAEVLRELFKKNNIDQSYSERQLYQIALKRLAKEFAVIRNVVELEAERIIEQILDLA